MRASGAGGTTSVRKSSGSSNAPASMPSPDAHVVGELVAVVGAPREVSGELAPDLLDRADQRGARRAGAQALDHEVAHAGPVVVAHARVDPRVADHGELPAPDRDVDQYAVAVRGPVHAELVEEPLRARERVTRPPRQPALQMHADLAGGPRLRAADRVGDRVEVGLGEKASDPAGMA